MSKEPPAYIARQREAERAAHEKQHIQLERRHYVVQFWTGIGIWATVAATAAALIETHCSSEKQLSEMVKQQKLIQGQLDTMVAQQRPWISAIPKLQMPLMLWDMDPGEPYDFFVPINFELRNHGTSPATNVTIQSMLAPLPVAADWLNAQQEQLCASAEQFSKAQKTGIAVFPGESPKQGSGIASTGQVVARNLAPFHYIMQGCIDYTYNGNLHGKTAYRIELGHSNEATHVWEGFRYRFDSQEIQPETGSTVYKMRPAGIDYRETDDGGNWAR